MAKRPIVSVATDFDGVIRFLTEKGLFPPEPPRSMLASVKRMHAASYSLILWRFRLLSLPQHSAVFLEEVASDALQILPHAVQGYNKTTRLLIRGVAENTLRHIYFTDHPVEYARMNAEKKWYIGIDDLLANLGHHPAFEGIEQRFDAANRLKTLYDELSASVHGRRVEDLEMRVAPLGQGSHPRWNIERHRSR